MDIRYRGKMIPSELERLVLEHKSKGNIPFFVNCTAGTTVYGAFDPIHEIADICKKYKLWLHIDVGLDFKYTHLNLLIKIFLDLVVGFAGCMGRRTAIFSQIPSYSFGWN